MKRILGSLIGLLAFIWICLILLIGCGKTVKANDLVLIRNQSDCRDQTYWESPNYVKVVYIDGPTKNSITYLFYCNPSTGLLESPVELSRTVVP